MCDCSLHENTSETTRGKKHGKTYYRIQFGLLRASPCQEMELHANTSHKQIVSSSALHTHGSASQSYTTTATKKDSIPLRVLLAREPMSYCLIQGVMVNLV